MFIRYNGKFLPPVIFDDFSKPDEKSPAFIRFVNRCLVKNPAQRATASQLLQDPFIQRADSNGKERLLEVIHEATEIRKRRGNHSGAKRREETRRSSDSDSDENGTIRRPSNSLNGTMIQQVEISNRI